MGFAKVHSVQNVLLKAQIIDVETDVTRGLHSFSIVGLPDKAVEESRDRVSAAIKNTGLSGPKQQNKKIIVSLAPADLKKEGPLFDVGIALSYLLATEEVVFDPKDKIFIGELSLDGMLRPVAGILPLAKEAKDRGFKEIYLPNENAREAALIEGIKIFGASSLKEIIDHLDAESKFSLKIQPKTEIPEEKILESEIGFGDIRGQETAKRVLEIAAAGGHNVAMYGPPGTGKTMLAKAFRDILPPLSFDDILETTAIHSVASALSQSMVIKPPFRSPHHTASYVSIVGGGANPKPGEVTLAHRGVLFLDEFPEFESRVVNALRQPLEERYVNITRIKGSARFPADFILIAAMNPCPCGNYGFPGKECVCSASNLLKYQRKISGPILDRIDLWIEVPRIEHKTLSDKDYRGESGEDIRARVISARQVQKERFNRAGVSSRTNASLNVKELVRSVDLGSEAREILDDSAQKLMLSPRVYHKIIKVAQTIADLEKSEQVLTNHILEAIQYRPKKG